MNSDLQAEYDALIAWQESHTRNPGHDLTGCNHCRIMEMTTYGPLDDW